MFSIQSVGTLPINLPPSLQPIKKLPPAPPPRPAPLINLYPALFIHNKSRLYAELLIRVDGLKHAPFSVMEIKSICAPAQFLIIRLNPTARQEYMICDMKYLSVFDGGYEL